MSRWRWWRSSAAVVVASVTAPGELLAGGTAIRVKTAAHVDALPAGAPAVAPPFVQVTGAPGGGWLEVEANGVVWAGGGANYFGDLQRRPNAPAIAVSNIVQVRPTPDGFGYWLVGSDGSVYSFGDALYFGSLPGLGVHASDVVGLIPFSSGAGVRDRQRHGAGLEVRSRQALSGTTRCLSTSGGRQSHSVRSSTTKARA